VSRKRRPKTEDRRPSKTKTPLENEDPLEKHEKQNKNS